jgi:hypothetical protein
MEKKEEWAAMRIFFHGNRICAGAHTGNKRYAGFILPATVAAVMICTALYCVCFSLISARHGLLQKQAAEWDAGLERHNSEVNERFGAFYAAD